MTAMGFALLTEYNNTVITIMVTVGTMTLNLFITS